MPEDPVRLQLLLHHRDKQLDEMAERFKELQKELENRHFEVTLARQEAALLEEQLLSSKVAQATAALQAPVSKEQAKQELETLTTQSEEPPWGGQRIMVWGGPLDSSVAQRQEKSFLKEQTIRHQTTAMEALNRELKELG
eukprot:Skav221237  [mRNA]  locus=scaffold1045:24797:29540:- [translate_table: standard]